MKNQQTAYEEQDSVQEHWPASSSLVSQRLAEHETRTQIPSLPADLKSWIVLLVEDNDMVRELIKLQLEQLGYHVLCAKNGKDALQCFRERHDEICLVLSDVIMPEMDGWATLAAIKSIRFDTPVVLASGFYEPKVKTQKRRHQPQAFIQKPFKKKVLKETLETILNFSVPT